jgi:hypothetical protein
MHCVEKHALVSSDALVSSYSLVSYISYTSMQACERMLLSVSCVCVRLQVSSYTNMAGL